MLCSPSASFNPILAEFNLPLTPWQGPAILWNRPKIWSKCAPTPLSRWFIISGLIAFPPQHTHTHCTMNCVFLMNRNFESGWGRERERVGPVVISSLLCLYQVYVRAPSSAIAGRPVLCALPLYILTSTWLYCLPSISQLHILTSTWLFLRTLNTGMLILQNQELVWKGNSQFEVIQVSFQTCVALKIRGSCRQLSSFMILMTLPRQARFFLLQPAGNTTAVKTPNHHPPMATFWGEATKHLVIYRQ